MSLYKFVKDNASGGSSKRLFMEGGTSKKTLGPPIVTHFSDKSEIDNLQAVYTKKHLSTEVLGSSIESTKTSRRAEDGTRRITTKIVRKLTTLTRGEEKSVAENLTKRAKSYSIQSKEEVARSKEAVKPKKVKVRPVFDKNTPFVCRYDVLFVYNVANICRNMTLENCSA